MGDNIMFMDYTEQVEYIKHQMLKEFNNLKKRVEIPFDARKLISNVQLVYGDYLGETDRIGKEVLIFKTEASVLGGKTPYIEIPDTVGVIVGDFCKRVLVYVPENELFIGWLEEDEFKILDILRNDRDFLN